ncbi:SubName: Full=Uncharacterized protein {ECO:0000313/EMBL:CCA73266.1} [Serendipita indica DSM 11827]|nr:SubName: Full=Uncharacterized protein {ECO:0000313/EMBL:CCA73266.1} [Serendipita indica DSM 11827]
MSMGRRYIHPRGPTKSLLVPDGKFDILFFGGDEFSCRTLEKIYEARDVWRTLYVVTQHDMQLLQRGARTVPSPVRVLAEKLGLQVFLMPKDNNDFKVMTFPAPFHRAEHHPPQLLVTSSVGRYIPMKILKRFHHSRRLNVHPSLIPKYRGAAPIQWAIADGLEETGVSVIEVEQVGLGYDVGDIWAQKSVAIPPNSTHSTMWPILAEEGSELLISVLRNMIAGTQPDAIEQDNEAATDAPVIDSVIATTNWWEWDAKRVECTSRAFLHQKPIFTYVFDSETTLQLFDLSVLDSTIEPSRENRIEEIGRARLNKQTGNLEVTCANGTRVGIARVKQKNRNLIPAKEWWIGVPEWKRPQGYVQFHMGANRKPGIPAFDDLPRSQKLMDGYSFAPKYQS